MLNAGDEEGMELGSAYLTVVRKRGAEGGIAESARPFMISTFTVRTAPPKGILTCSTRLN